jgi:hypothetical protein
MKKLLIVGILILFSKIGFAQKNFEGELDYKLYSLDDTKKDTTFGHPLRFIIGKNAIKIQRLAKNNTVVVEEIVQLDSLKVISIDNKHHVYWISWRGSISTNFSKYIPWGMNKKVTTKEQQKILGINTHTVRLTDVNNSAFGYIDLAVPENLYFQLSSHIGRGLFIDGELFLDDHIMLKMTNVVGVAPHTKIVYQATSVQQRNVNPYEFDIPKNYALTTVTQFNQDVRSEKLKSFQ